MQESACEADWADLLLHPGERDWVIAECAQKLCCDGKSVPCAVSPANTGLSPGGKVGVAVAVVVFVALLAGVAGFVCYKKRHHLKASESQMKMKPASE